jgi:hypothetical protein
MRLTADIIYSGQAFPWVPDHLSFDFMNLIFNTYYGYKSGELPDLHVLTDATRDVILKVASHQETNGRNINYWSDVLKGMGDNEEKRTRKYAITDPYYEFAFRDVERLLRFLNLSYINSENPKKHVNHFVGQVW